MSNLVISKHSESILVISFDRPEIRNPLSVKLLERLSEIIESVERDLERVIFSGAGDVFASGADLREISALNGEVAREFALRGQELMTRIADLPAITVAAVNGYCFGGALDLALACDRRIGSPTAVFCHPGVDLGIMTGWGGTQRLPRLVGEAKALEMFLTGRRVNALEAKKIGLIDEIAEDVINAAATIPNDGLSI